MNGKRLVAGFIGGWIVLLIELGILGASIGIDFFRVIFPESVSQLSLILSGMVKIGLIIDLITGTLAAFNIGGWRSEAFGFLAGILTVIMIFGGLLSAYAPQVVEGLWGSFFAVLLPIFITIILALVVGLLREQQEYVEQEYYY